VFQVHYVDEKIGEIVNRPIKRAKFIEHLANRALCLIEKGACRAFVCMHMLVKGFVFRGQAHRLNGEAVRITATARASASFNSRAAAGIHASQRPFVNFTLVT
jgi:hypothetical protein